MNPKPYEGKWNETKGRVKEEVGHAFGKTKMDSEGGAEQIKVQFQGGFAAAKDAEKKAVDHLLHRDKDCDFK